MVRLYHDLPDHGIRLFKLHYMPSRADALTGELVTVKLTDQIQYNALSYVWGKKRDERTIHISGVEIKISSNLDLALRQIREVYSDLPVWIDQICINSADHGERGHQVRSMGRIYATAQQVLVILCACNILQQTPPTKSSFSFSRLKELARQTLDTHRSQTPFAGENAEDVGAMHGPFGCEWWTRMWTAQELIFARSVTFFHHGDSVAVDVLEHFCIWYMDHVMHCCRYGQNLLGMMQVEVADLVAHANDMFVIRRDRARVGKPMGLLSALTETQGRDCTDSRDKIYALASLTKFPADMIDYSLKPQECYTTFAKFIIESSGQLKILRFISTPQIYPSERVTVAGKKDLVRPRAKALDGLPSWVPDWSLPRRVFGYGAMVSYLRNLDYYQADDNMGICLSKTNERSLAVRGIRCTNIVETSATFPELNPSLTAIIGIWSALFGVSSISNTRDAGGSIFTERDYANVISEIFGSSSSPIGSAVMPALLTSNGRVRPPKGISKDDPRVDLLCRIEHLKLASARTDDESALEFIRSIHLGNGKEADEDDKILHVSNSIIFRLTLLKKHLILTSDGRLGFASVQAQAGDVVCVLFGGNTPFVLREEPGRVIHDRKNNAGAGAHVSALHKYRVVGEAYLQGMMAGEAVQQFRDGQLTEENFLLV